MSRHYGSSGRGVGFLCCIFTVIIGDSESVVWVLQCLSHPFAMVVEDSCVGLWPVAIIVYLQLCQLVDI